MRFCRHPTIPSANYSFLLEKGWVENGQGGAIILFKTEQKAYTVKEDAKVPLGMNWA
jgi:hypothetical protein